MKPGSQAYVCGCCGRAFPSRKPLWEGWPHRARGQGLGAELLRRGLKAAEAWLGKGPLRIEAQTYAKGFYEKFGFRQVSEEFLEDGIPHIQMLRE